MSNNPVSQKLSLNPKYVTDQTKYIYLTLDDGPHPIYQPKFLRIFEIAKIKVTFFVIGQNAEKNISLVKEAFEAGHRIGSHSYNHPDLSKLSEQKIKDQVKRTEDVVGDYLGDDKIFRPPYGAHNKLVDSVLKQFDYRIVLWNVDTLDWNKKYQPDGWVQHGIEQIRDRSRSVVLNHDIHKTTLDNYNAFIDRISSLKSTIFGSPTDI